MADVITPYYDYDLKRAIHRNRLAGLWRLMTGFRLTYLAATICLGIAAIAKTTTYLLLRYFIEHRGEVVAREQLLDRPVLGVVLNGISSPKKYGYYY